MSRLIRAGTEYGERFGSQRLAHRQGAFVLLEIASDCLGLVDMELALAQESRLRSRVATLKAKCSELRMLVNRKIP